MLKASNPVQGVTLGWISGQRAVFSGSSIEVRTPPVIWLRLYQDPWELKAHNYARHDRSALIATRNEAHVAQTASLVAAIVYEISPPVRWTEDTLPFSEGQFEKPRGVLAASHDPSLESKHAAPSKYFPGCRGVDT
jgi:hypothetical protein